MYLIHIPIHLVKCCYFDIAKDTSIAFALCKDKKEITYQVHFAPQYYIPPSHKHPRLYPQL